MKIPKHTWFPCIDRCPQTDRCLHVNHYLTGTDSCVLIFFEAKAPMDKLIKVLKTENE